MSKPLAVLGCTLVCDNPTAQATITTPPSMKVTASNKACYKGALDVMVVGATMPPLVQNAPAQGKIVGTATKVLIENMPAVLMGDKSTPIPCMTTDTSTGAAGAPIIVTVTIADAGQMKALGS